MLKSRLNVRNSTPNKIALTEQLKFIRTFMSNLVDNTSRKIVYDNLVNGNSPYIQHYIYLHNRYISKKHLYATHLITLKDSINTLAQNDENDKFYIYKQYKVGLDLSMKMY